MPDAENPDRQVRRNIDASNQKNCSQNNVRDDRKDPERQIGNGYRQDGTLHQKEHGGQSQRGGADHRSHARGNLDSHLPLPAPQFAGGIPEGWKK
jgi:hypothetical protein